MKLKPFMVLLALILTLVQCKNSGKTDPCNYDKFLKDPSTPAIAKELYNNTYKLQSDDPLSLLEYLESEEDDKRTFYFRVITNMKKIADGAVAEGLGGTGKEYIEKNTKEFASYFDEKNCFTDQDLSTWADIVMLEFSLLAENEFDKALVEDYNKQLLQNCKDCSASQQATLAKFTKLLESNWNAYLKSIDNPVENQQQPQE